MVSLGRICFGSILGRALPISRILEVFVSSRYQWPGSTSLYEKISNRPFLSPCSVLLRPGSAASTATWSPAHRASNQEIFGLMPAVTTNSKVASSIPWMAWMSSYGCPAIISTYWRLTVSYLNTAYVSRSRREKMASEWGSGSTRSGRQVWPVPVADLRLPRPKGGVHHGHGAQGARRVKRSLDHLPGQADLVHRTFAAARVDDIDVAFVDIAVDENRVGRHSLLDHPPDEALSEAGDLLARQINRNGYPIAEIER